MYIIFLVTLFDQIIILFIIFHSFDRSSFLFFILLNFYPSIYLTLYMYIHLLIFESNFFYHRSNLLLIL